MGITFYKVSYNDELPKSDDIKKALEQHTGLGIETVIRDISCEFIFYNRESKEFISKIKCSHHNKSLLLRNDEGGIGIYKDYSLFATLYVLTKFNGECKTLIPSYAKLSWDDWSKLDNGLKSKLSKILYSVGIVIISPIILVLFTLYLFLVLIVMQARSLLGYSSNPFDNSNALIKKNKLFGIKTP
jgi:hypothetical protein